MPSRWRSRISERSNSANAPITDSSNVAIAVSSPVKVSCSLANCTRTPRAVSVRTRARKSSRLRARRSIECTNTVSPSRTNDSNASSSGRAVLRPEALSVNTRSSATPSSCRSAFWSRLLTRV